MKIDHRTADPSPPHLDPDRREILKMTATSMTAFGVLAAAGPAAWGAAPRQAPDLSHGADNFYRSDKVDLQQVSFKNQYGMRVAGNLFTPKSLSRRARNPAIIVGHPMGAVKEQSANLPAGRSTRSTKSRTRSSVSSTTSTALAAVNSPRPVSRPS